VWWDRIEAMNAAHTVDELIDIANHARALGQWNERLANVARGLAAELNAS